MEIGIELSGLLFFVALLAGFVDAIAGGVDLLGPVDVQHKQLVDQVCANFECFFQQDM